MNGETYENAEISMVYSNWGTEDEPEYVWLIMGMTGVSDEVEHMIVLSERATWDFSGSRPFLKAGDLAIIKDAYALRPAGRDPKSVQIGAYGANIDGEFFPQFMLLTVYSPEGEPECNYWIDYTPDVKDEIYNAIKGAIENLDIPHAE